MLCCFDLFRRRVNIKDSPKCQCGYITEDVKHYFLDCPLYIQARTKLFLSLSFLQYISYEILLFGSSQLSFEENEKIMLSVHSYIKETRRF